MSDELWRLLTLQDPNTRIVLLGAALLGLGAGAIGSLAVLRRRALVGDALAHAALPGVWIAFYVLHERSFLGLLIGAALAGAVGVASITFIRNQSRIKEDAAIGIVLSTFFAAGICLSRIIQSLNLGNSAGLDTFLLGRAAAMLPEDVYAIAASTGVVLLFITLLFKEFRMLCFDREYAAASGWPVYWLDLLIMGLLVICTVVGLPAVGVVLMAALLIIPAAAARFWTQRLGGMIVLAGLFGALTGLAGTAISTLHVHISTGPAVVLCGALVFLISMLAAPSRGVIPQLFRRRSLERRIALQNLLRAAHEMAEKAASAAPTPQLAAGRDFSIASLAAELHTSPRSLLHVIRRAARAGLIELRRESVVLTGAGAAEAARIVRTHRLWEMFLVDQASVAPDHVDRDADQIEHILPPEMIARLEARLRERGQLPARAAVPASPHPLGESAV